MPKNTIQSAAKAVLAVAAVAFAVSQQAHAALPAEVTTAIDTAGTDLLSTATQILGMMVGFWGVKKVGTKMGWW